LWVIVPLGLIKAPIGIDNKLVSKLLILMLNENIIGSPWRALRELVLRMSEPCGHLLNRVTGCPIDPDATDLFVQRPIGTLTLF
jgi:hypothetical protein